MSDYRRPPSRTYSRRKVKSALYPEDVGKGHDIDRSTIGDFKRGQPSFQMKDAFLRRFQSNISRADRLVDFEPWRHELSDDFGEKVLLKGEVANTRNTTLHAANPTVFAGSTPSPDKLAHWGAPVTYAYRSSTVATPERLSVWLRDARRSMGTPLFVGVADGEGVDHWFDSDYVRAAIRSLAWGAHTIHANVFRINGRVQSGFQLVLVNDNGHFVGISEARANRRRTAEVETNVVPLGTIPGGLV